MAQMGNCARVAFFGGSFDPPHQGHLAIARAAQSALGLDTVLFAPVGAQPLKPQGATASFADRLAMTKLAIAGQPEFTISLVDAPAQGQVKPNYTPNYTIDTLRRLRAEISPDAQLFCLIGADSFVGLRTWHRGAEIPIAASLIVASRPGQQLEDLASALPVGLSLEAGTGTGASSGSIEIRTYTVRNAAGATAQLFLLPGLHIDISASEIRNQVRAALGSLPAGHDLLPDSVVRYIAEHGLYRD